MHVPTVGVPASFVQTSPVRLSATVLSPLSLNLGSGHTMPFFKSPSCPVPAQEMSLPSLS
ncbi:hypothetical protein MBAV_005686 [Candidatus Magnetobacterium bavaricum]|uniref:Uncharacterized protein n=1 Tax=Candidatus Magnetobacterium bavaricum TaxID=29290 RepID=A0A0F3GJW9_9BACT|nr:hypothetical protein MBAV_005686 [Candidatus Magnetobacterium bavaricum]